MAATWSLNADEQRTPIIFGICALVTAVFFVLHWMAFVPLNQAENYARDWLARLGRKTPVDPRLVFVGIDRPSYAQDISESEAQADPALAALRGNFPWSRVVWAALIERLAGAGAKVIVIDLVFSGPGEGDAALRQALEKFKDHVVISCNFNRAETDRGAFFQLVLPNADILPPSGVPSAALDDRVGYVNVWPDWDGILRQANYRKTNRQLDNVVAADADAVVESLAARALRKFGVPEKIPAGFAPLAFRYTAGPGEGFRPQLIGDVLSAKAWQANYQKGEFFRGKIVLVGPAANIFQDRHRTPFTQPSPEMLGPEAHLNIINAALHDEFLRELPLWSNGGLITLAGLVAAAVCQFFRQPIKRLSLIVGLSVGYLLAAQGLFDRANLVVPVVSPLLVLNGSGFGVLIYDFVVERLERMKLRHTMGLYFSPRVLDAVLADPGSMKPHRAEVTLLLTDLRNSTPLAEALGPKDMFKLLNLVFEAQTNAIMSEEGNLEHFLGDQFLSYWGAPQKQRDGADRAERAAIHLIDAMEKLRTVLPPQVRELFGYGVALHSGRVLFGNKGSAKRLDFGLVGDAVNEAARIESLTKYYGVRLLISREAFGQLSQQGTRRLVDRIIVKGKSAPVELFERENLCTPNNYAELCRRYKAAYDEYFFGRFSEAQTQFQKLAEEFADGASRILAARCAVLAAAPPADWKGIWRMEAK